MITIHLRYEIDPEKIAEFREYEQYRLKSADDPECVEAYRYAVETKCIRRYERRFLSPVFE